MKKQNIVLLSTILVASAILTIYKVKNDKLVKTDENNLGSSTNLIDGKDKTSTEAVMQKLSILGDKCRGCGRCMRIDPEHFEINTETGKANVISALHLNSENLKQAIINCPDGAISLK